MKREGLTGLSVHNDSRLTLFELAATGSDLSVRILVHCVQWVVETMIRSSIFDELDIPSHFLEPLYVLAAGGHGNPIVGCPMKHTNRPFTHIFTFEVDRITRGIERNIGCKFDPLQ